MLIEIIYSSISTIENKRNAQDSKQSAQAFSDALVYLSNVSEQLSSVLDCVDAIKEHGISAVPILSVEMRNDLAFSVNDCGRCVYEGTLRRETVKVLQSHLNTIKNKLDSAWKIAASAYSDGPKGYLSMLGGLTDNPSLAKELETAICDSTGKFPTKKSIKLLADSVSKAQALTSSFALKPDIELFLKKIKEQRATVADLSPEVLEWLKEKSMSQKLKVKF